MSAESDTFDLSTAEGFIAFLQSQTARPESALLDNLTPEQRTILQKSLKDNMPDQDITAQIGHLMVPNQTTKIDPSDIIAQIMPATTLLAPAAVTPASVGNSKAPIAQQGPAPLMAAAADMTMNKQELALATRLNSLVVGGDETGHALNAPADGDFESTATFTNILKGTQTSVKATGAIDPSPAPKAPDVPNVLGALPNLPIMYTSAENYGLYLPVEDASAINTGATLSTPALTNVVTQAAHATQAHPATQMVAATIQKSAGDTGLKNITLQLDPPDLGKVEIRMEFGKQKNVTAQIVSEKPETHFMLQRDTQILERILQDAGLDADGGLSFELADDGYDFNHNGRHDGHAGGGTDGENSGSGDELAALLETTMTWHVDPETGHMRYNILA